MANNVPSLSSDSEMRQRERSRNGSPTPAAFFPPELDPSGQNQNITGQELDMMMSALGGQQVGPNVAAFQLQRPRRRAGGTMSDDLLAFFQMLRQLRRM